MKWTLSALILFSITCKAQTTTTLPNAKATETRYINIQQFGLMNNGHPYTVGITLGAALTDPCYITRIDLTTKVITTKVIPGAYSHTGAYWNSIYDSSGILYIPWAVDNYHVFAFDLKPDSIVIYDNGLVFKNNTIALAYSSGMGTDGKMYFGAKGDPYVSYYNQATQTVTKYDPINSYGIDWVLGITGSSTFIYATTGQNDSCNFWAIRKSDGTKWNLIKTPNYTRPTVVAACDGNIYVSNPAAVGGYKWYRVDNDTSLTIVPGFPCYNTVYPAGTGYTSFFDRFKSRLYWSIGSTSDSVDIVSSATTSNIASVFTDRTDSNYIYYIGAYYGSYYKYDIAQDAATTLGSTGYNISGSVLQYNDSIYYMPNYPSGTVLTFNKNKAWTTNTYINGNVVSINDSNANPKFLFAARSTPAIIHHVSLQLDAARNSLIFYGEQERTDYTCSIGSYNLTTGEVKAYDASKIVSQGLAGIAQYGNLWLMSTNNAYGGTPKIYYYNPDTNTMTDSISFGFTDYGRIWVQGEQLLGQTAAGIFYKVNLSTKQLTYNQTGTGNPICIRMANGSFLINGGTAPAGWAQVRTMTYGNYKQGKNVGTYFSTSTTDLIKTTGLSNQTIDLNTAAGKEKYIRNLLYNQ